VSEKIVSQKYEKFENCFLNLKLARNSFIRKQGVKKKNKLILQSIIEANTPAPMKNK